MQESSAINCKDRFFITGVNGYIASNLARDLVSENYQVVGLVRPNSDLSLIETLKDKIQLCVYDGKVNSLVQIFKDVKPKIVFHLASCFIAEHAPQQIDELITANILFGTHLLEAMQQTGVKKIVNTGTVWQHYKDEDYNPVCLYAASKEAFAKILKFYVVAHDFNALTLELFDTYGPFDPRKKLINLFKRAAVSGEQLLMSPGEQKLDLVYIDDVVCAYKQASRLLLTADRSDQSCYSIATQQALSLKEIANLCEKVFHAKLNIVWGAKPYRKRELMSPWGKAKLLPGWRHRYNLEDGLTKLKDIEFCDL